MRLCINTCLGEGFEIAKREQVGFESELGIPQVSPLRLRIVQQTLKYLGQTRQDFRVKYLELNGSGKTCYRSRSKIFGKEIIRNNELEQVVKEIANVLVP